MNKNENTGKLERDAKDIASSGYRVMVASQCVYGHVILYESELGKYWVARTRYRPASNSDTGDIQGPLDLEGALATYSECLKGLI